MSTKIKLNYSGVGKWLKESPQVDRKIEEFGKKALHEVKAKSELAEQKMKGINPKYKEVHNKNVHYEKGTTTDRQTGYIVIDNMTPADYLYNPFV